MDKNSYDKQIENILENNITINIDKDNMDNNINLLLFMFIQQSDKYRFRIKNAKKLLETVSFKIIQYGISDNIDIVFLTGTIIHNSDLNTSQRFLDYVYNNYRERFYKVGCGVFGFLLLQPITNQIVDLINITVQRMGSNGRFVQYIHNRKRLYELPKRLKQIYLCNKNIQFTIDLIVSLLSDYQRRIFLEAYNE